MRQGVRSHTAAGGAVQPRQSMMYLYTVMEDCHALVCHTTGMRLTPPCHPPSSHFPAHLACPPCLPCFSSLSHQCPACIEPSPPSSSPLPTLSITSLTLPFLHFPSLAPACLTPPAALISHNLPSSPGSHSCLHCLVIPCLHCPALRLPETLT